MAGSARRPRSCDALAEQRSALVDGALDDGDRERVLAHLVDCPECRAEVAELQRLRRLLNGGSAPEAQPSYDLADRLVAIAGQDAREPLLAAPFRLSSTSATSVAALRRRGRRLAHTVTGVGLFVAGSAVVVAVGLAAAPPVGTAIADPTAGAQAEFSTVAAQLPLADSVGSVLMASGQNLGASLAAAPISGPRPSSVGSGQHELDAAGALAVLRRAASSSGQVSFSGTQEFHVLSDGTLLGARVSVQTRIGNGREVTVYDANGRQLMSSVSAGTTARVVDSDELSLLDAHYLLGGSRGAEVAGREATVVSASRPNGQAAARWWVDDASGLLLWHETYDETGRTTVSAGFTAIRIGEVDPGAPVEAKLSVPLTSTSLTLGNTGRLTALGWTCPDELEGLSLVRLRADQADTPTVVHLAYSDGISSVSVFEQRGRLVHAPSGTQWDDQVKAYVRGGAAKVATWQSGTTVFTVVTDGSHSVLTAAVGALPHEATPPRTTIDRVRAGWARILESVTG
ncbi:MAG TPA: zf-HC2 domain-containing protein [Microlunatus sp.]|nr:zf-HC2 domain-containing protein [Microlunatus sp.]